MMTRVAGIKSVDFKIKAFGYGVVNWNGTTPVRGSSGMTLNNHSMPKLRGYTNFTGEISDKGHKFLKEATDIDFSNKTGTPLYISQNCIRHHLFRDHAFDLHNVEGGDEDILRVLASMTGLIRGYVLPKHAQCKRTSPLLLTDFVDLLGNGNFEQMGRAGTKEKETNKKGEESSNSIFSKTTFGDTEYEAYGSISIEQLEFISLVPDFDRAAMIPKKIKGEDVANKIQEFIKSLDPTRDPKVSFHTNYVRKGTIFDKGEGGVLLDNTAIDILVKETLKMLLDLSIRQAKGYMYVDSIEVDYNDSNKMMRIKRSPDEVNSESQNEYAVYFDAK